MRVWTLSGVIVLLGLFCLSCVGGKSIERSYYALQYTLDGTDQVESGSALPFTLRINRFDANIAYDRQEIVYRSNPHEFRYYWYKLWAAKPEKLVREQVLAHLRHSGLFTQVSGRISGKAADFELNCVVNAIEELDTTNTQWFAHLDLNFKLSRVEDGNVVFERRYTLKKQVAERRPVFVVRALSELLREEMRSLTLDIAEAFRATPGGTLKSSPTLSSPAPADSPSATLRRD